MRGRDEKRRQRSRRRAAAVTRAVPRGVELVASRALLKLCACKETNDSTRDERRRGSEGRPSVRELASLRAGRVACVEALAAVTELANES